jgi:hypothetical protein
MNHCSHFVRYLRSGPSFEWCERCGAIREGEAPSFGAWRIPITDFELLARVETPSDAVNFLSQIPPGSEMEARYMGNSFIESIMRDAAFPRSR